MKNLLTILTIITISCISTACAEKENDTKAKPTTSVAEQKTDAKFSYIIGYDTGKHIKNLPVDFSLEQFTNGFKAAYKDRPSEITEKEGSEIRQKLSGRFQEHHKKTQQKQQQKQQERGEKNKKKSSAFLEQNKTKTGIKTTESGLQYQINNKGTGKQPKKTDTVKVHYRGTLIDGKEFDSTHKRGQPTQFQLDQVIPGWTEGLMLMNEGAKYTFFIPSELAYGERGAGPDIPPHSALIFEVELLKIIVPQNSEAKQTETKPSA